MRRLVSKRGAAIVETALIMPMVLLVSVGIFEFGRAFQTWEVLTNAAREAARVAVLPGSTLATVQARALSYMNAERLSNAASATITVDNAVPISLGTGGATTGSQVTVAYPFQFMVLQPVAQLVVQGSMT